jgi:hypothetical protein
MTAFVPPLTDSLFFLSMPTVEYTLKKIGILPNPKKDFGDI